MPSKLGNITFYADDPRRLAHFWASVFHETDLAARALAEPPEGEPGPRLFFHHAQGPKSGRNRLHIDVSATPGRAPSSEELEAEKDRLVALGAEVVRLVDQSWGPWPELYYQLRDPEGNEFCLQ
jgi:predicted enzyme related to lactoylglutathione lyase